MQLRGTGVWSPQLRFGDDQAIREACAELEQLGYTAAWLPDAGGDVFGSLRRILDATTTLVAATGILNLWMHTVEETATGYGELTSRYPGRVLLGLGVSHAALVDAGEPGRYRKPLKAMQDFLDGLDRATPPVPPEERVLAALGPRMLELARDRAGGAHPYLVTPEHTRTAREALGPDHLLAPEQKVCLETDADKARALAREQLSIYLTLPNYLNNLDRLGFGPDDVAGGGSDRLVDALVAWGDIDAITARVQAHRDAGADHVCIHVLADFSKPPTDEWRRLAPALIG